MKDLPNTDSGLFPVEHMNRPDTKKKTDKSKTSTWSEIVYITIATAKKIVNDPIVESVDIKLSNTKIDMSINYKENEK
jgi:hypothetical protein